MTRMEKKVTGIFLFSHSNSMKCSLFINEMEKAGKGKGRRER